MRWCCVTLRVSCHNKNENFGFIAKNLSENLHHIIPRRCQIYFFINLNNLVRKTNWLNFEIFFFIKKIFTIIFKKKYHSRFAYCNLIGSILINFNNGLMIIWNGRFAKILHTKRISKQHLYSESDILKNIFFKIAPLISKQKKLNIYLYLCNKKLKMYMNFIKYNKPKMTYIFRRTAKSCIVLIILRMYYMYII